MKNKIHLPFLSRSFDQKFIVDKRGKTVFFPWRDKSIGYTIKSNEIVEQFRKFYSLLSYAYLITMIITASTTNNFWVIIGAMFIGMLLWSLVYYLYISNLTKSLRIVKKSYKDIVLEKIEQDETNN